VADDIVTRLRTIPTASADNCEQLSDLTEEAADEIERLRAAGDALLLMVQTGGQGMTPAEMADVIDVWQEARRG
jgi:hypothetical protein